MSAADRLGPMTIAISTSDTPDLAAMGLSEGHLNEAAAELAVQLLAHGANLAYAGDLRANGFARLLSRLVLRYTPTSELKDAARVTNHLAWPEHIRMPVHQIEQLAADLRGPAEPGAGEHSVHRTGGGVGSSGGASAVWAETGTPAVWNRTPGFREDAASRE